MEPPIRAEIFGAQRFAQHGHSLGETHRAAQVGTRARTFYPRLASNIQRLREAKAYIAAQASTGYDISPAAEWLLDNFHLIEAQLKEIHEGLPRSYFRKLPVLQDEPLAGLPRIYSVAWAFVAHTDGAFDEDLAVHFLSAYQESRELNLSEMWALPTTLRVVLIENLRRLAERVATNKAAREVANLCCDDLDAFAPDTLDRLLALLNRRGVGRMFLAQMAQRLQDQRTPAGADEHGRHHAWLRGVLPDLAAVQAQQPADQAADNLSVSNAVTSLRAIGDADWPDIVARTSTLMQHMLGSPLFAAEHMATRDQTLHEIEVLARRCGRSEVAVAQALLGLMQGAEAAGVAETADRTAAVAGHWLRGPGRPALLQALGLERGAGSQVGAQASARVSFGTVFGTVFGLIPGALSGAPFGSAPAWRSAWRRAALPAYLAALLLGTVGLVAWMLVRAQAGTAAPSPWFVAAALLMLFPASEAVVAVINRLISESARPLHLPRLALADGIPAEHRVLVVIPALLTDAAATAALLRRLLLHHLANPEPHAQFALLTDWADADSAHTPADAALLNAARDGIRALNAQYPALHPAQPPGDAPPTAAAPEDGPPTANAPDDGRAPRFILLHRERRFSETEQRWIGWERKRGKLEMLVRALAAGQSEGKVEANVASHGDSGVDRAGAAFLDLGRDSMPAPGTRYIVTLDSDTQLPPGRLRDLVGVAAHPQNQPQFGADGCTVLHGYGILQPRVVTPLPAAAEATLYHWLFAGQCGIDPYSAATSEVYQDLFGEGTFTGKGLLNVQAMHAVLSRRLPDGQVLSHDLLEGSLARCAAVTDITVIEEAPFHADVAASRVHRWTRGDWQLLPFLLPQLFWPLAGAGFLPERAPRPAEPAAPPGGMGKAAEPPLPMPRALRGINRWKMFDNLRRSLVAPMSLALLLLALAGVAVSPWAALALVAAAFCAGPLMGAVAGFSPSRDDLAKRHFYRDAAADLARALLGGLWWLAQLLQQSLLAVDAVVRALYRMTVSRRHLLQWTTAAAAQAAARTEFGAVLRRHWSLPPVALLLLGALFAAGTPHPLLATLLCLLWGASPVWTWWVSRTRPVPRSAALPADEAVALEKTARDTWRFFERCVTADEHHLPPDNLQTTPHDIVAHRTSPTNIGLYLLAAACARAFGWIGTEQLLTRLEATLATLAGLQRHRGHFLNWYDTQTCAPLLPMYVSTVDSGNLSGHLLAVAQACLELLPASSDDAATTARLKAVAQQCEQLAWQADFGFLYHRKRHLFHIGYRVAEQQLDAGFYDLLASESRLTSLLAIAKGDVPVRHWGSLGRPFYAVGSGAGLRSWSGSMFEYLMPTLVLAEPRGSVLHEACRAALLEQIAFADAHHVPWGISESAYAGRDHTLAFQYAPQGVPRLALRRTPPDELVIAPYATALAALVAPHRASRNFAALAALGARADYGFIEAIDFSPGRQTDNEAFARVDTFMAHHQGMTIVALANVLLGGPAQRWGMANAHIEAVASLLHERVPREVSALQAPPPALPSQALLRRTPRQLRDVAPGTAALEPTHVLSNGRYSVALRANGAGWSRWVNLGVTRWRDDALRDEHGSFFYLRTVEPGRKGPAPLYSITQHPAPDPDAHYDSRFHADRVCFDAAWPAVQAHTTVWVSPEDDIEFRQVEVRNLSDEVLEVELISAFEVTLADARADEAHPAFGNLFVRAQWQTEQQALVFERRPRLPTEQRLHAAHFLAVGDAQVVDVRIQTDRARWLGRNRAAAQPMAVFDFPPAMAVQRAAGAAEADIETAATERPPMPAPDITLDTGLDPVCALSVRLRIAPHGKAELTFATAATDDRGTLHAVIDKYRQPSHVQRASLMSATLAGIRLRTLRISTENYAAIQTLTTALVLSLTRPQPPPARSDRSAPARSDRSALARSDRSLPGTQAGVRATAEVCDRRLLWRFGISGDRPLILVSAGVQQGLGLLRALAQALRLWAWNGVACDLVVVNAEPASYLMALQREIAALRERHEADSGAAAQRGAATTGFHLLRADELSADELSTLHALARVRFNADGRPLVHHVQEWSELHEQAFDLRYATSTVPLATTRGPGAAVSGAGSASVPAPTGAFSSDGREFRFDVGARSRPARPWINVLANPAFGAQISEAGGGCTWAVNSRMNQLTAWSNDPVADPPSEWFLLQDRRTLEVWSVAPSAWGAPEEAAVNYRVAHGQGCSVIGHRRGDVDVTASWCVDPESSVKQVRLRIINRGHRTLQLRIIGIAEWMMGAVRADRSTTHTALFRRQLDSSNAAGVAGAAEAGNRGTGLTALLCTQRERAGGFGDGTAFLSLATPGDGSTDRDDRDDRDGNDAGDDWTCDRRELFDARGHLVMPDHFGKRQGGGLDPCAALATRADIAAGDTVERVFLLGYADSPAAARELAARAAAVPAPARLLAVRNHWDRLLGATTVHTPDPLFDALVNRWLLYQTVACRLWAKAAFYQAGGATGFRDQLQDAMALAWADPAMLRAQIVLCASRQFEQGDVQHWWHAPGGAGVRTHFSDDLLWLPHACVHYLHATGDATLLDQSVPFIEGAAIPEGAEDAYYTPEVSMRQASIYEHAARAIDRSLRVGAHGLPLMGSGDWNDGMNRVGAQGRGESVWLGWFLHRLVGGFAPLARERGDTARAQRWTRAAEGWQQALNGPAWDGQWFKRAFFDDGQPLGSQANAEARIDLIAQAWAVLSGATPPAMQRMAMAAVEAHLVDHDAGLIKLLDPPLVHAVPSAGYIQAYPPGVRENGGQYSHAGVWALMAQAQAHVQAQAQARVQARARAGANPLGPVHNHGGGDLPYRSFTWLSPAHRARDPHQGAAYAIEPYVMAGDVYTQPPYVGRGGWSWYTGSAAWMHRAAIESIFGLRLGARELSFTPCLPSHWQRAELTLARDGRTLRFILTRVAAADAVAAAARDCKASDARLLRAGETLRWSDDGDDPAPHRCFVIPLEDGHETAG